MVYVSHRLGEVLRLADTITVLKDGRKAASFKRGEVGVTGSSSSFEASDSEYRTRSTFC